MMKVFINGKYFIVLNMHSIRSKVLNFILIYHTILWYNNDTLIINKPICLKRFSNYNLQYVTQLIDETRNTKE